MKARNGIVFVFFALAMMSVGYLAGWHRATLAHSSNSNSPKVADKITNRSLLAMPPIKTSPRGSQAAAAGKMSLEDIKAKLLKLNRGNWYRDPDLRKILDNLDVADFPQLLAFVDTRIR